MHIFNDKILIISKRISNMFIKTYSYFSLKGAGLFAAVFFLLLIVADVTPHGTDKLKRPLIGIYLYLNMILVIFAMGVSAVVIWIHDHTDDGKQDTVIFLLRVVTNQDARSILPT